MAAKREELTRKWISRRFTVVDPFKENQSAASIRGKECRLKIERTINSKSKTTNFALGQNGQLNQRDFKNKGTRRTSLLLSSGRRGSIRYNDELIGIRCVRGGQDNYQIEIMVDSDQGGVSTATSLRKGQRLNIGQIVDQNRGRSREANLRNGVSISKTKTESKFNYFLMID
jgi:hypothetical protein